MNERILALATKEAARQHIIEGHVEWFKACPYSDCAAVRAASPTQPAWQAISTAPKDGTPIWGYEPGLEQRVVRRDAAEGIWKCIEGFDFAPTHWMPLPLPPEAP